MLTIPSKRSDTDQVSLFGSLVLAKKIDTSSMSNPLSVHDSRWMTCFMYYHLVYSVSANQALVKEYGVVSSVISASEGMARATKSGSYKKTHEDKLLFLVYDMMVPLNLMAIIESVLIDFNNAYDSVFSCLSRHGGFRYTL